jgi:drug/metabolite transporter (DMT)-like permease
MIAGGLLMLPLGLPEVGSLSISAGSALAWLYLVTIGSVVGFTAYTWLLAKAPLGLVSTYAYVNPVVAILLGVLFRNESVSVRMLVGAAIVVGSVAMVVRREPPSAALPEEVR